MDGLHADDAGDLVRSQYHRLAQSHPAVYTAYKVKAEETVLGSASDDEAHLVHVGRQQQAVARGLLALLKDNEVAQGVGAHIVGVGRGLGGNEVPHGLLVSRHTS